MSYSGLPRAELWHQICLDIRDTSCACSCRFPSDTCNGSKSTVLVISEFLDRMCMANRQTGAPCRTPGPWKMGKKIKIKCKWVGGKTKLQISQIEIICNEQQNNAYYFSCLFIMLGKVYI